MQELKNNKVRPNFTGSYKKGSVWWNFECTYFAVQLHVIELL